MCKDEECESHIFLSSADPSTSKSVITTKGVHGLVADPLFEHQLASFVEEQIYIWDLRNFDKPVSEHFIFHLYINFFIKLRFVDFNGHLLYGDGKTV